MSAEEFQNSKLRNPTFNVFRSKAALDVTHCDNWEKLQLFCASQSNRSNVTNEKIPIIQITTWHENSNTPNWVHLVHILNCPSFLLPGVKSINALLNCPLSFDECALISNKDLNTSFVCKTASYKVMENCPSGLCAGMSYQQSPVDLSYQANPKLQFQKSNIPLLEIRRGAALWHWVALRWNAMSAKTSLTAP